MYSYGIKSCPQASQSVFRITIEGETSNREGEPDRKQHTHFDDFAGIFFLFFLVFCNTFSQWPALVHFQINGSVLALAYGPGSPGRPPPAVPGSGKVPPR